MNAVHDCIYYTLVTAQVYPVLFTLCHLRVEWIGNIQDSIWQKILDRTNSQTPWGWSYVLDYWYSNRLLGMDLMS